MRLLCAVFVVLTAGCGSSTEAPSAPVTSNPPTTNGTELPVEVTEPQPEDLSLTEIDRITPRAAVTAPVLDRVIGEIRWKTLVMTKTRGEITASCAGNRIVLRDRATTNCTSTFNGVALQWQVDVEKGAGDLYAYTISPPDKVLLLGKRVYADFLRQNVGEPEPVQRQCDTIPDVSAVFVPQGSKADTGYKCQFLSKRDDGDFTWTPLQVILDGTGFVSFVKLE